MPFLTLNGALVPVASFAEETLQVGGVDTPSYQGRAVKQRRALRRRFTVRTTTLTSPDTLRNLRRLLSWEGHVWSWDTDYFSSRGIGPFGTIAGAYSTGVTKYGAQSLDATGGANLNYKLQDFTQADGVTLMCWAQKPANGSVVRFAASYATATDNLQRVQLIYDANNGFRGRVTSTFFGGLFVGASIQGASVGWHHLAITFDVVKQIATFYFDGNLQQAIVFTPGSTFYGGVPTVSWGADLAGANPWTAQVDDCVCLPWAASPSYVATVCSNGYAHPPFPELLAGGTFISDGPLYVVPSGVQMTRTGVASQPAFSEACGSLDFTLEELQ